MPRLLVVKLDAEERQTWAVLNETQERMLAVTFNEELIALLFVAICDREGMIHDTLKQEWMRDQLRKWLDAVAPRSAPIRRYALPGERLLPRSWALSLVDTSDLDEQSLAQLEYLESELIADLWSNRSKILNFLLAEFGEWEPAKV